MTIGLALAGFAAVAAATAHKRLEKNAMSKAWLRATNAEFDERRYQRRCHDKIDIAMKRAVDYGVFLALADQDPDPDWRGEMRDQASNGVKRYLKSVKNTCKDSL